MREFRSHDCSNTNKEGNEKDRTERIQEIRRDRKLEK